MILPIVAYGAPILRKKAQPVTRDYPGLEKLVADMWQTMYASSGVGLAATQVNRDVRIFVMDSHQIFEHQEESEKGIYPDEPGIKQVFINPQLTALEGEEWSYNEGCLSIPKIREDIFRPAEVTLTWQDEEFNEHRQAFNGLTARIIQHEYDHLEGRLFIDYLKPLRKKMLQGKLNDISKGNIKVDYKMTLAK